MHGSRGVTEPASPHLLSEPAILAGIAKALFPPNPALPWDRWVGDYSLIREEIAAIFPEIFHDFNARMGTPGGFRRPLPAAKRQWKTPNGKANFTVPRAFDEDPDVHTDDPRVLRLMTIRSDDQFNTTIYTLDDRFRGVYGTRRVLFMNPSDIERLGFAVGDRVTVSAAARDQADVSRSVEGLRVTSYDIPQGCAAGYYPECNPLIPLWHHAEGSCVPAAKAIPVRLTMSSMVEE
jgi:anaerobic selenocysteine-containing dehydrogenase